MSNVFSEINQFCNISRFSRTFRTFSRSPGTKRARTRVHYTPRYLPKGFFFSFSFSPPIGCWYSTRVRINPQHKHVCQPGRSDDSAYTEQYSANAQKYPTYYFILHSHSCLHHLHIAFCNFIWLR